MTYIPMRRRMRAPIFAGASVLALAACDPGAVDLDLRGLNGGFTTADAARAPLANRPRPDNRGVISYPNYQVVVARRGDTLTDVANRVGVDPAALARFNGLEPGVSLRRDEIIALPSRVAEPSPATGARGTGPIQPVDISALANNAIDRSAETPGVETAGLPPASSRPAAQTGKEPVRHKVARGETAYTISRLYNVPVKALAEWNGLGSDFAIREGQYLLIPVAKQAPPQRTEAATTPPGAGSPTPTPPSATKPLPDDDSATPLPAATEPEKPVADVGQTTSATQSARMVKPVDGSIIREYAKGRNEGISIQAAAGSPVKAADTGTVAAITESAEGVPIIVLRHRGNLLTVYANVADVAVAKGDRVRRGQTIAKLRDGRNAYVHFEVRQGFDSVDPAEYIN